MPSLIKKYLMSITGLMLAGFVFFHMLGNLQVFMQPEEINTYAYFLHDILPVEFLWAARISLLVIVIVHIIIAIQLKIGNNAARPDKNCAEVNLQSSAASRYMINTGFVVLFFIIYHIQHFTILNTYPEFQNLRYILDGKQVHDVYAMIIYSFSGKFWFISATYIFSVAVLGWHLSHGVSSMFQSLGLRNKIWRARLDKIATAFGLIIFLGMASIPSAVLISEKTDCEILPTKSIIQQLEKWDGKSLITINYQIED
jgi:succinate dehydrogenase / fumarate reductase, cytochrome b subunit